IHHSIDLVHFAEILRRGKDRIHSTLGIDQFAAQAEAFLFILSLMVLDVVRYNFSCVGAIDRAPKEIHFLSGCESVTRHRERISHVTLNGLNLEQLDWRWCWGGFIGLSESRWGGRGGSRKSRNIWRARGTQGDQDAQ